MFPRPSCRRFSVSFSWERHLFLSSWPAYRFIGWIRLAQYTCWSAASSISPARFWPRSSLTCHLTMRSPPSIPTAQKVRKYGSTIFPAGSLGTMSGRSLPWVLWLHLFLHCAVSRILVRPKVLQTDYEFPGSAKRARVVQAPDLRIHRRPIKRI